MKKIIILFLLIYSNILVFSQTTININDDTGNGLIININVNSGTNNSIEKLFTYPLIGIDTVKILPDWNIYAATLYVYEGDPVKEFGNTMTLGNHKSDTILYYDGIYDNIGFGKGRLDTVTYISGTNSNAFLKLLTILPE